MAWQLLVIDGADKGRFFNLDEGTLVVGSNRKHTDICLHDLYVARVHCEVQVAEGRVLVRPTDPGHAVLYNGEKIVERELMPGDVIRVGNTCLRLTSAEPQLEIDEEDTGEAYDLEVVEDADDTQAISADDSGVAAHDEPAAEPEVTVEDEPAAAPRAARVNAATAAPPVPAKLPHLPLERMGELTGKTLARYEIGPALRSGPRSVVFRARDQKTGLVVALRVLSPLFPAKDTEMEQFIKTLRVVLPLRHRNLVALWNAGRNSPYCWVAMDYVEGESLAGVLEQLNPPGKFAWKHALRLGVHLARALNYVHHQRLAHGNVTPPNILIRTADKTARLGDLMLARALQGSALEQATRERRLRAELAFQPPERVTGLAKPCIVSDIYSLGACVYARCTGRPPFGGKSVEETVRLIQQAPLVPLKQQQPAIPDAFEAVVLRMLAREREDRYQTPADVLAQMESLAESEDVEI
jgi:hypothetical protein